MQLIEFYSHEQQDEFVFNIFKNKRNGFFLDIACGHPVIGSNTYTLERFNGWSGFGMDIGDVEGDLQWSKKRTSPFIRMDATSSDLTSFLKNEIPKDTIIDYISLDVDNNGKNLAFLTLEKIIDSGVKFKSMTFEHEAHCHGDSVRGPSRKILESLGYTRMFEDVMLWGGNDRTGFFEDWWIHPNYFDSTLASIQESKLYYFECIEKLRAISNVSYEAQHNCCKAFPNEYRAFWHAHEEQMFNDQKEHLQR